MDKEDMAYAYNGILLSHKKEWNLPFGTAWMDLEGIMLYEMSERERQILYDFTFMCKLKSRTNDWI